MMEIKELTTEFVKARDEVKALGEELKGRMGKGEKLTDELKGDVDGLLTKMNNIDLIIKELEQKAARNPAPAPEKKSLGDHFIESDVFAAFKSDPAFGRSARVQIKADISSNRGDGDGKAGALVQSHVLPLPQTRLTVRDLISGGQTDSSAITYIQETGFINAAATVAEGDIKPQSSIKFGDKTVPVQVVAYLMKASRQILDNAPALASTINQRLMYGLKLVEEDQILYGDGTGSNLLGIIPQASAFANPTNLTAYTVIDQLRLAQLQAIIAEYPATGYVLNPIDWTQIELTKDTIGRYIIGNPQTPATTTIWGLPVVTTPKMASGKFLTGAFKLGAQLFDRGLASVVVATPNEDDFSRKVSILCEERLALAVYRPEAFIYGSLSGKS